MQSPFELHASAVSIEKTEDYHTASSEPTKRFKPKLKIAKAVVHCFTIVKGDTVEYSVLHPAFNDGEARGSLPYKDYKDEERALYAGVWEAFLFFSQAGYHHLEIVTTSKRMRALVNGDIECQNSVEEEMLAQYNQDIRQSNMSVEFRVVEEIPRAASVTVGDSRD